MTKISGLPPDFNPSLLDLLASVDVDNGLTKKITLADLMTFINSQYAWQNYTPTFAGLTLGNGTINYGRYVKIGKLVHGRFCFTFGSTSDVTGAGTLAVSPPVPTAATYQSYHPVGIMSFHDAGSDIYFGRMYWSTANSFSIQGEWAGANYVSRAQWTTTSPFDTATGDQFLGEFTYESAD